MPITGAEMRAALDDFAALLVDAVESGGSVSFVRPLAVEKAREYWRKVADTVEAGGRLAWAARDENQVIGCVMLEFAGSENGRHRAEVQKLLVHSDYRGQGIAKRLMATMESGARAAGLTLLVLDTVRGSTAETLYGRIGYTRVGVIPQFARLDAETMCDTVYFYRLL
jgi:GNAT superfamily N-acetyltransferase